MDIATVVNTGITTIGLIAVAYLTHYKVNKLNVKVDDYHKEVNGKMGQLLEVTKEASKAEGKLEQKAETDAKKS